MIRISWSIICETSSALRILQHPWPSDTISGWSSRCVFRQLTAWASLLFCCRSWYRRVIILVELRMCSAESLSVDSLKRIWVATPSVGKTVVPKTSKSLDAFVDSVSLLVVHSMSTAVNSSIPCHSPITSVECSPTGFTSLPKIPWERSVICSIALSWSFPDDGIFQGYDCCGEGSISFHYVTVEEQYLMDFLFLSWGSDCQENRWAKKNISFISQKRELGKQSVMIPVRREKAEDRDYPKERFSQANFASTLATTWWILCIHSRRSRAMTAVRISWPIDGASWYFPWENAMCPTSPIDGHVWE